MSDPSARPYRGPADLLAMQRAVQRSWTPQSRWHIGDLAWQRSSMADRTVALWADPDGAVDTWAWISPAAPEMALHASPGRIETVLSWFDRHLAGRRGGGGGGGGDRVVTAMDADAELIAALESAGYRPAEGPFFRHCLRDLDHTLPKPHLPDGYRVRAIRPGETAARAAAHRAAWRPRRVGRLQVPPVDLGDGESGLTTERYAAVAATWPYRPDLDQVVVAPDGTLVATALGWHDDVNRVSLLEPVGTDPAHARRGLGAAVSLACLHAMREAGAELAVVCPRGDPAYPVPRALYHQIGFRDAGRTVNYRRSA